SWDRAYGARATPGYRVNPRVAPDRWFRDARHAGSSTSSRTQRSELRDKLVGIQDRVAVALLRQEALAVLREVLVDGVAGHERVEVGGQPRLLRPQQPPEALRLLLAGAERARHLDRDRGLRQVDREVGDLRHHEHLRRSVAELLVEPLALGHGRRARELGRA